MNLEIYQLLLALMIGAIIGTEREYRSKSAGLRTMIMVSLASCLFTMLSLRIGVENPDRLAANILTGLGFLGAGVILKMIIVFQALPLQRPFGWWRHWVWRLVQAMFS